MWAISGSFQGQGPKRFCDGDFLNLFESLEDRRQESLIYLASIPSKWSGCTSPARDIRLQRDDPNHWK